MKSLRTGVSTYVCQVQHDDALEIGCDGGLRNRYRVLTRPGFSTERPSVFQVQAKEVNISK